MTYLAQSNHSDCFKWDGTVMLCFTLPDSVRRSNRCVSNFANYLLCDHRKEMTRVADLSYKREAFSFLHCMRLLVDSSYFEYLIKVIAVLPQRARLPRFGATCFILGLYIKSIPNHCGTKIVQRDP